MRDGYVHGGDAARVAARLGVAPESIVDFSSSVNPFGPPEAALDVLARGAADASALARYPDPELSAFREAVAAHLDVPSESVVVGNGSSALVGAVARALGPARAVVPVPAFGEYARALGAAGFEIVPVALDARRDFALDADAVLDAVVASGAGLVVLTNPHNPSGAVSCAPAMRALAATASAVGASVLLDEAFVDYAPNASLAREAPSSEGLVVLRSVTKFYAVPALRVGCAIASPSLAVRVREQLDPWPVTTLAADAVAAALADRDYARRTRAENKLERARLAAAIGGLPGLRALPSAANFLLVELGDGWPRATELRERLVREHGVLVRDCSSFVGLSSGGYVRVSVRSPEDDDRLVAALAAVAARPTPSVSQGEPR